MNAAVKFPFFIVAISAVSSMLQCVGQGSVTEVACGRLMEPDGMTPAQGASVVLRPREYLANVPFTAKRQAGSDFSVCSTHTDIAGYYRFVIDDSTSAGCYCIEGRDNDGNCVLVDSIEMGSGDPYRELVDTLRPPAAIRGKVPWDTGATEAYVRVFGLDVYAMTGPDGAFFLGSLPAGELRLQRLAIRGNERFFDTVTISVKAGDTATLMYAVTFDPQGGSAVASQTVKDGDYVTEPPSPVNKTCSFAGWFKEPACSTEWKFTIDKVIAPTTLHAKWIVRDVDGNVYKTVKIGNQVWFSENLKATRYNDGTEIPLVTDSAAWSNLNTPAYCWHDNDEAGYKNPFGALYNWYAVNTGRLAPAGWHVSTDGEWDTLQDALLVQGCNWDGTTDNTIAKALASNAYWREYSMEAGVVGNDCAKNNSSGFSALPGSGRYEKSFGTIGDRGIWWSTREFNEFDAVSQEMRFMDIIVNRTQSSKKYGLSVRCVRDE